MADQDPNHLAHDLNSDLNVSDDADQSQSSKIKSLMGILKKVVGVKDLAAIRFSLPANLMEPVPNLEYWTYLDRADLFAIIPDFDQPLDRMLGVIRFALTKDLEIVKNGPVKPYNSILGENTRCHWDVETPIVHRTPHQVVPVQNLDNHPPTPLPMTGNSHTSSVAPTPATGGTATPKRSFAKLRTAVNSSPKSKESAPSNDSNAALNALSSDTAQATAHVPSQKRRVVFLTEQVSHHPPISTYYGVSPEAGIEISGVDQISGRFTGTSVRLYAGSQNRGIFLKLLPEALGHEAGGERYRVTHPTASINGLLKGSLWVSMGDATVIDCYGGSRTTDRSEGGSRLRAVIEYKEEGWLTKAKYALEGVIYEYDWRRDGTDDSDLQDGEQRGETYPSKVKQVPEDKVVATFEGQWNGKVTFKLKGESQSRLLIDLGDLNVTPKGMRPIEEHGPLESRKIWAPVTQAIQSKQYSQATKSKQEIEQAQRELAAERKRTNQPFVPQFFVDEYASGRPTLTEAGKQALAQELSVRSA